MKQLIKKITIFLLTVTLLTSCSKVTNTNNIEKKQSYENQISDNVSYEVNKINLKNSKNISSVNDNILVVHDENESLTSCISIFNISDHTKEIIDLNTEVLSGYEEIYVSFVRKYDDFVLYSGSADLHNESGSIETDSYAGIYNLKTKENTISIVKDYVINKILLDTYNNRIVCSSWDKIYTFDMNLSLTNEINCKDYFSDYLDNDCMFQFDIVVGDKGDIFIGCGINAEKNYLLKLTSELDTEWIIDNDNLTDLPGVARAGKLSDGSIIAYSMDMDNVYINVIDESSPKTTERYEIPRSGKEFIANSSDDYDYILKSDDTMEFYLLNSDKPLISFDYSDYNDLDSQIFACDKNNIYNVHAGENRSLTYARVIDCNGKEIKSFPIEGCCCFNNYYITDNSGGVYSQSLNGDSLIYNSSDGNMVMDFPASEGFSFCGASKNLLFIRNDEYELYSMDGSPTGEFSIPNKQFLTFSDKSGNETVYTVDENRRIFAYDIKSKKNEAVKPLNEVIEKYDDAFCTYDGGVYDFYIETSSKLFAYNIGDNKTNEVSNSLQNIITDRCSEYHMINEEGVLACFGEDAVYILTPYINADNNNISVAYIGEDGSLLSEYVRNYNSMHTETNIDLIKYRKAEEFAEAVSLNKVFDIIVSDGRMYLGRYAEKGMFTDLKIFIDKDDTITNDEYMTNLLSMYSYDDKIYKIFPSFHIELPMISKNTDTEQLINDPENYYKYITENNIIIDAISKTDPLKYYIPFYIYDHTQNDKKVDFQTDEFIQLLNMIKQNSKILYSGNYESNVIEPTNYIDFTSLKKVVYYYDNKMKLEGFPGKNGPYISVVPELCYSITERCTNKEEAWEIVKTCFMDDISKKSTVINKKKYDQGLNELLKTEISEDTESFNSLIQNVRFSMDVDPNITDIITDEAKKYFNGEANIENTVDIIQNKVNIYIDESSN